MFIGDQRYIEPFVRDFLQFFGLRAEKLKIEVEAERPKYIIGVTVQPLPPEMEPAKPELNIEDFSDSESDEDGEESGSEQSIELMPTNKPKKIIISTGSSRPGTGQSGVEGFQVRKIEPGRDVFLDDFNRNKNGQDFDPFGAGNQIKMTVSRPQTNDIIGFKPINQGNQVIEIRPNSKDQGLFRPNSKDQGLFRPNSKDQGLLRPNSKDQGLLRPNSKDQGLLRPNSKDQGLLRPNTKDQWMLRPNSQGILRPNSKDQGNLRPNSKDLMLAGKGPDIFGENSQVLLKPKSENKLDLKKNASGAKLELIESRPISKGNNDIDKWRVADIRPKSGENSKDLFMMPKKDEEESINLFDKSRMNDDTIRFENLDDDNIHKNLNNNNYRLN